MQRQAPASGLAHMMFLTGDQVKSPQIWLRFLLFWFKTKRVAGPWLSMTVCGAVMLVIQEIWKKEFVCMLLKHDY